MSLYPGEYCKFALEVGIRRVAASDWDVKQWNEGYLKLEGKL